MENKIYRDQFGHELRGRDLQEAIRLERIQQETEEKKKELAKVKQSLNSVLSNLFSPENLWIAQGFTVFEEFHPGYQSKEIRIKFILHSN